MVSYLIAYKYLGLITLSFAEGPIVSIIAGYLSRLGFIELPSVIFLLVVIDIISDLIYYHLGYYSSNNKILNKLLNKRLSKKSSFLEVILSKHLLFVIFFGKLAYGVSVPIIISVGALKINLKKFLMYSIPISIFQTFITVMAGYLLGEMYYLATYYLLYPLLFISFVMIFSIIAIYSIKLTAKKIISK